MFYTVSLSDTDECVVGVIMFILLCSIQSLSLCCWCNMFDECVVGVIMFILLCSILTLTNGLSRSLTLTNVLLV